MVKNVTDRKKAFHMMKAKRYRLCMKTQWVYLKPVYIHTQAARLKGMGLAGKFFRPVWRIS